MDRLAIEQPIDFLCHTTVTAEQPVITKHQEVARLCDRLVRRLRHRIRVGQALGHLATAELCKRVGAEPKQLEVYIHVL